MVNRPSRRRWLPSRRNGRCLGCEPFRVKVALALRIHLDHRVADRRAGREDDAVAGVLLAQIAGLHVEVEGPLAASRLDSRDTLHLRGRFEVFARPGTHRRRSDRRPAHRTPARRPSCPRPAGPLSLSSRLAFCFSSVLMMLRPMRCLVDEKALVLLDLLAQESLLEFLRHPDPLEAGMRDDDRVPVARGDLGGQRHACGVPW